MSGPLVSASAAFVAKNSRIPPYAIEQSLRFDWGSFTRRDPSSAGNRKTWTFSFWLKRAYLTGDQTILMTPKNSGYSRIDINSASGSSVNFLQWNGSSYDFKVALTANRLRDPSAWYHIVVAVDTTQSTASNRVKFYVNGSLETELNPSSNTYPSQNFDIELNGTGRHYLGVSVNYGPAYLHGYLAEVNYIDGSQLEATDFGEYDDNGVWRPIEYSGSYTGNSYYLKFDASDVEGDSSGLNNDWSGGGFVTSGTGTDVMSDTPTTNWATLNPLWNPIEATYAEGNLKFTGGSTHSPSASSISASSGKLYFEATALSGSATKWSLGIIDTDIKYRKSSGNNYIPGLEPTNVYTEGDALVLYNNNIYKNGSSILTGVFSGGAVAAGNVVQMAVDIDAGKIWFGINGTWNNGGGTEGAFNPSGHDTTFTANKDYIFHFTAESCGWEVNFGQRDFAYTPPTGFKALNTKNLPAPTVKDGSKNFNAVAYAGNNSTQSINVGFQPGFLWLKSRTQGYSHWLVDSIRGTHAKLSSDSTSAENTDTTKNPIKQFTSTGFDLQYTADDGLTYSDVNASGQNFIAWNWLAGNGTSSNTDGTITSTVSANTTAGFSIVSYTASGTDNDTVGHGLGVQPSFHIVKSRDGARDWLVYTREIDGSLDFLRLNTTAAAANSSANAPTSTVFSIYGADINTAGEDCIAYCFAEVENYSKFGSYTGNGSTDGPFIATSFAPAWLLIKQTNSTGNWYLLDSARATYNPAEPQLNADLSSSETSYTGWGDLLSNGFKIRRTDSAWNGSGSTYIYAAFAENPFGGSGVSPATAR